MSSIGQTRHMGHQALGLLLGAVCSVVLIFGCNKSNAKLNASGTSTNTRTSEASDTGVEEADEAGIAAYGATFQFLVGAGLKTDQIESLQQQLDGTSGSELEVAGLLETLSDDPIVLENAKGTFVAARAGDKLAIGAVASALKVARLAIDQNTQYQQLSGLLSEIEGDKVDLDVFASLDTIVDSLSSGKADKSALAALDILVQGLQTDKASQASVTSLTSALNDLIAASDYKYLRIIASGTGHAAEITTQSLTVGASFTVRAAYYDRDGTYIADATTIVWSTSSGDNPSTDISATGANATFTPSRPGSTTLFATYTGSDPDVIRATDSTGSLTIASSGVVAAVVAQSGNGQSAVVDNFLSQNITVEVRDSFSQPLQGVSVTFAVTSGGGSLTGTNPGVTDSSGRVSVSWHLGTSTGSQSVRATAGAAHADFSATALHGSPATLDWSTQPSILFAGMAFGVQPQLRLLDTFGNLATSASGSVTLSVQAGSGSLTGSATGTLNSGVVTFSNLGYDTAEAGVVIAATYGGVSDDSNALTVAAPPPGACQANDAFFRTADGGCKDQVTGLVWSSRSAAAMTWVDAVWGSDLPGNVGSENADDYGRTTDYGNACGSACDGSAVNYCKNLNEGGKTDWRLPTLAELQSASANSNAASPPYLDEADATTSWSSTTDSGTTGNAYVLAMSTGASASGAKWPTVKAYCVRGGRTTADRLAVTSGTSVMGVNHTRILALSPIKIQIRDSLGQAVARHGVIVSVATDLGSVGGTATATTDTFGVATFDAFTLSSVGDATLTFSATGFTSITHSVRVGSAPHTCKVESSAFVTEDGGCKQVFAGKVWSLPSATKMTWYDAIWEYVAGTFNVADPTDGDDGINTNDYADRNPTPHTTYVDNSTWNYCHQLNEGGYTDWRMPTATELDQLYASGAGSAVHMQVPDESFWSSNTGASACGGSGLAQISVSLIAGTVNGCPFDRLVAKTSSIRVICVRP